MESWNILSWELPKSIIKSNLCPQTTPKNDIRCKASSFWLQTSLLIYCEVWSSTSPAVPGLCRGHGGGRLNLRPNICEQQSQPWCGPREICVGLKWDYKIFERLHTSIPPPVQLLGQSGDSHPPVLPQNCPSREMSSLQRELAHFWWGDCAVKKNLWAWKWHKEGDLWMPGLMVL